MSTPSDQTTSAPPAPEQQLGGRSPRTIRIIAAVVTIVIVLAGVIVYYELTRPPATTCALASRNPLIYDQPEAPDTLDPQVTFSTPGWGAVQQVYQTLVMYNNSDYKTFLPVLAQNYSSFGGGFNWTFHLRSGIHFSNGDPLNAYTIWFSLYRTILINQAPEFILGENFFLPGLVNGTITNQTTWMQANMTAYLSSWNFASPTASALAFMKRPDQSFQVIDSKTLQINLGYGYLGPVPYTYILSTLAAPVAAALDPAVVQANGGVQAGSANTWLSTHMIGSGPYVLTSYNPSSGMVLSPDSGYWGTAAATAEPWNNILQPAQAKIQLNYQGSTQTEIQDLKSGAVASASFAYVGPSTVHDLQSAPCVTVNKLSSTYSSTSGGWWIYMNQNTPPFDNLSVRAAVVHAINYQEIINVAFGGNATQWVGPVPPGYPNYNPSNLQPYQYNLALAKQEMNNSPYPLSSGGFPGTLKYEYINLGDWGTVATLLKTDLAKIGININPVGIPLATLYSLQLLDANGICASQAVPNQYGGPFPIGQEFYTSDYIAPDDWTQNNAISWGSANACMSQYNNPDMDTLVIDAAGTPANATADYTQMTQMMYQNYTNAWLVVPQQYQIYNPLLQGVISNPMGSGLPFTMMFNTEHA